MQRTVGLWVVLALLVVFAVGCTLEDDGGSKYDPNAIVITANITSPTTWQGDKVYVIEGSISVTSTLTIPAGTIIKFAPDSGMVTSGSGLVDASAGTALDPITFTSVKDDTVGGDTNLDGAGSSPGRRDWNQIRIQANGSLFNYCNFYYGGGDVDPTLWIDNVSASVTYCTFAHNDGTLYGALDLGFASAGTVVTGNRFYDNVMPLRIHTTFNVDASNSFSNLAGTIFNTRNGIFVSSWSTITGAISWSETDVAYVVTAHVQIDSTESLALAANVVLKFASPTDGYIAYWAGNFARGAGVAFTSYKDDTLKGDTNGDVSATSPAVGDWLGISDDNAAAPYVTGWGNIFYAANSN